MKRYILLFILLSSNVCLAHSENILSNLPNMNHGMAYSVQDSNFNYLTTFDVASWKTLTLEAGYAGRAENTKDKAIAVASIKLIDMQNIIKFPILDKIVFRPGIWAGTSLNRIDETEFDWGVSASVISLKF